MSAFTNSFNTSFAICGVCGGEHDNGFGYAPNDKSRILWACNECLAEAPHVYGVAMKDVSTRRRYELQARTDALAALGEYLLALGKTDFMDLEEKEAGEAFDVSLKAYRDSLRKALVEHAPPF